MFINRIYKEALCQNKAELKALIIRIISSDKAYIGKPLYLHMFAFANIMLLLNIS